MGSYNILHTTVLCSNCKNFYSGKIQFKFGNTWQFHYKLGEKITWGGNDTGIANAPKVKVYGILEENLCPICKNVNEDNEFDILFENDIIKCVQIISNPEDYLESDFDIMIK